MSEVVYTVIAIQAAENKPKWGYLVLADDKLVHVTAKGAYLAQISFGLLGYAVVSAITRKRAADWVNNPPTGALVLPLSDIAEVKKGTFRLNKNVLTVRTRDGVEHTFGARWKKWQPLLSKQLTGHEVQIQPI